MGVDGEIVELAHGAKSAAEFRGGVLAALRTQLGFDSAIFFGLGADAGPPGNYQKPPEAAEIFRHYRENLPRYGRDLARGRAAASRDGAFCDDDLYSRRERDRLPFFVEIIRPQKITTRLVAYLSVRGEPTSVVHLCRHGSSHTFAEADKAAFRALVPLIALADHAVTAAPHLLDGLTARERQIATYVRYGYTNREIALLVGCSPNTVRNHLAAVFEKLGIATRAELAAWVAAQNPLPAEMP